MTRLRRPCANCPWRVDAPVEYWANDHFESLFRNCQDDGMHVMLCHKSTPKKPRACQGWVRALGFDAIGVRIAVMQGVATFAEVDDKRGPELYRSMEAMLRANGIRLPQRNRWIQR